jgi:uncharacterized protein
MKIFDKIDGFRKAMTWFFILWACTVWLQSALAAMPTVTLGKGNVVKLEVASTKEEIERGLMYRTALPEDSGMVFIFQPPRKVNFWMYHTLIPLDMLFISDGKIVKMLEDVPPCHSSDPGDCPIYPGGDGIYASEVIELKGGYSKRHGLTEGQTVTFDLSSASRDGLP